MRKDSYAMPDIMEAIEGRRSIRKYKDQQISREALDVYKRQPLLLPRMPGNKPWLIGSCEPMTRAGTRRI